MSSPDPSPKGAATADVIPFRKSRADTARQFLPAALEIIETPASPAGRAIGGTIILFFAI